MQSPHFNVALTAALRSMALTGAQRLDVLSVIDKDACMICQEKVIVPVLLEKCAGCNRDAPLRGCLKCVRTYLQLNRPKRERELVKHLVCGAYYPTYDLNAETAYKVDMGWMVEADASGLPVPACRECGKSRFNSHLELYVHLSPSWGEALGITVASCEGASMPCAAMCGFKGSQEQVKQHYIAKHANAVARTEPPRGRRHRR